MTTKLDYDIHQLRPYINWIYFFYAWGLPPKATEERERLRRDADAMLDKMEHRFRTHAIFGIFEANSDGDDLLIEGERFPMLRQQKAEDGVCLCLADFVRPAAQGVPDHVGAFATTVDCSMETWQQDDPYNRMMAQTLADRLAEATAEKMHEEVRKTYWGYAPDEHLSMAQLLREDYQGIRPAVGYPSLPDASVNFILDKIIGMGNIGIRLTQTGAMKPHASVSGLMFSHPRSLYFSVGKIGEDQLRDYARRRSVPVEAMRKFLAANIE